MARVTQHDGVTVIELAADGDPLDDEALEAFGSVLLTEAATAEPPIVLLDLSAAELIGSQFIELLVRAWKRLSHRGGSLALCGVRPFCAEVLHVTRLDTLWESFADQRQAIAALRTVV